MLDYTMSAIEKIKDDFTKLARVLDVTTQIVYIAYLAYTIFAKSGLFIANVILLVLAAAYFGFTLYVYSNEGKKELKKLIKKLYKYSKRIIKLFTLGVMLYGVWLTAENVTPLSLFFSIAMAAGFIVQILFDVFITLFSRYADLCMEGLKADIENVTKPVRSVGNFFKKLSGGDVEETKEPSKARRLLDKRVGEAREEKKNRKLEEKFLKASKKAELKAQKQREKAAKKAAKRKGAEWQEELATTDNE